MEWIIVMAVLVISGLVMVLMSITLPKFKIMQKLVDALNLVSREILTGLSVIRALKRKKEEERFDEANRNLTRNTVIYQPCHDFYDAGHDVYYVWSNHTDCLGIGTSY